MEANKKYKLTDETIEYNGHILHRIEALKDFGYVKKGDLGGYVESESNLSQEGKCWVGGNAKVYENSKVFVNAKVLGNAKVIENAWIYDNAEINGEAKICGNAYIHGNATIYGNAYIHNNVIIKGNVEIGGIAEVSNIGDYIEFKNNWSSGRYFTYTRSNNMWKVGCFYGTGKQLIKKAYKDSKISGKSYKAAVKYAETLNKIEYKNLFRKIATRLKNLKKIKLWEKNIS